MRDISSPSVADDNRSLTVDSYFELMTKLSLPDHNPFTSVGPLDLTKFKNSLLSTLNRKDNEALKDLILNSFSRECVVSVNKIQSDAPFDLVGAENAFLFYRDSIASLYNGVSSILQSKLTDAGEYQIFSSVTFVEGIYTKSLKLQNCLLPAGSLLSDCLDSRYLSLDEIKARRNMEIETTATGEKDFTIYLKVVETFISFVSTGKIEFYEIHVVLLDFDPLQ